jgi:hypothetical protein
MITERRIIEGMNHFLKDPETDRPKNNQTYSNPDADNLIILFTFLTFSQNAFSQQTPIDEKL